MIGFLLRTVLIAVATFLVAMAAAVMLLNTSLGSSFVENRLRDLVHPGLQVNGDVGLSVLPRLGVSVSDVTIPSSNEAHPWVSVKQAELQIAWAPLLSRTLAFDSIYVQGVELNRLGPTWQSVLNEAQQFHWMRASQWWPSAQTPDVDPGVWQLVIKQALLEDVAVTVSASANEQLPVVTLAQAELTASGAWPSMVGSTATAGLRQLSVNDAQALGHVPALLEQLGIAQDNTLDVMALDSQWQLAARQLNLDSLTANGSWGDMSAKDGRIDLRSGALAIPVKATLTNAPSLNTPGLRVQVRRSVLQFELTGTVSQPGVQWLTPPNQTQ